MGTHFQRRTLLRGGLNAVAAVAIGGATPWAWPAFRAEASGSRLQPSIRQLDGFTAHGPTEGTGRVTRPRTTGSPFTMVGLTVPRGGEVRLRTSVDGERYGPWQQARELGTEGEGPDGDEAREAGARWRTMSHLVWTGPAPSDPVTRGQMATFLTRAGKLPPVGDLRFRDVGTNHVHRAGIGAAAAAGIAHGYPDGTFRPDAEVTRGQMACFLVRGFSL
jgi:hypothetical protein